jgi:hypothetical protein
MRSLRYRRTYCRWLSTVGTPFLKVKIQGLLLLLQVRCPWWYCWITWSTSLAVNIPWLLMKAQKGWQDAEEAAIRYALKYAKAD